MNNKIKIIIILIICLSLSSSSAIGGYFAYDGNNKSQELDTTTDQELETPTKYKPPPSQPSVKKCIKYNSDKDIVHLKHYISKDDIKFIHFEDDISFLKENGTKIAIKGRSTEKECIKYNDDEVQLINNSKPHFSLGVTDGGIVKTFINDNDSDNTKWIIKSKRGDNGVIGFKDKIYLQPKNFKDKYLSTNYGASLTDSDEAEKTNEFSFIEI